MTLTFLGLCACVIALAFTIIICELLYEVHKEIRKGNVELLLHKDKRNDVSFKEGDLKAIYKDYYIYQEKYLLQNLDREYEMLKHLREYEEKEWRERIYDYISPHKEKKGK